MDETAAKVSVRIITPDRPGLGFSTHDANRTLLVYPARIAALAGGLGYGPENGGYRVLGSSDVGPYALACAKMVTESELKSVGLLVGVGLLDTGEGSEGVR